MTMKTLMLPLRFGGVQGNRQNKNQGKTPLHRPGPN